jgi:hypothetical protein
VSPLGHRAVLRHRRAHADHANTYIKATVGDVARVLAAITGEPHPLAFS